MSFQRERLHFFYYTNLHLMVIFNTYKCADWRKFLIFTDITKKKQKTEKCLQHECT